MDANKVYLALRATPPDGANFGKRAFARSTKERLVSDYCHGAVAVTDDDGRATLLQSNFAHGVHSVSPDGWQPEKWVLFETDRTPARVLDRFAQVEGESYDLLELAMYFGIYVDDSHKLICFGLDDYLLETDIAGRKTPERLLSALYKWSPTND